MLVTFKTKSYANIVMFGEVGLTILEMMGYGTSIPGAIVPEDVSHALSNLQRGLESVMRTTEAAEDSGEEQPAVDLHTRALPLIELLQSAIDGQNHVRWE
jgi:hypothetical protein